MRASKYVSLPAFAALVVAIWGALSLLTNTLNGSWYLNLKKPFWLPPEWMLEGIWFVLYILIAVSGWRVWNRLEETSFSEKLFSRVMVPYWSQLIVDLAWSILFFGLHQPAIATLDIFILLMLVGVNIIAFRTIDKDAAKMLVPYFIWVCYATTLSLGFTVLN